MGFELTCFLALDTSLEKTGGIIRALHHPALQGNKPLSFAAWLCFFKKLGGKKKKEEKQQQEGKH